MRRVALVLTLALFCFALALAAAPAPAVHGTPAVGAATPAVAVPPPALQVAAAPPDWLAPQITCSGPIIQRCDMYCQRRGCGTIIGPPPACSCSCSC